MQLSETSLNEKQQAAITRLYETDETILVAPTGDGKTVICLTAIFELIKSEQLRKVIVAAPAKILETLVWPNEAAKWDHLRGLSVVQLTGDSTNRTKTLLSCPANVIMISLNNLEWLLNQDHEADGIIIDELSKAAGKQTAGLKNKRKADQLKWRVGMTATPVSQDFQKLYGMCRIIDKGIALGTNKQTFLEEFFNSDYMGYNLTLRAGADERIMTRLNGLVHAIEDKKSDKLPPLYEHIIRFQMPIGTREIYNDMKEEMVAEDIEAVNAAVQSGKLRQIASGFMYDELLGVKSLDAERISQVIEWCSGLRGKPGLVFYEFVEQYDRLNGVLTDNIRLAQINSMSHGVEGLQHLYADVLFVQPIWSRDAAEQAVGRVWRTGQTKPVNITTLVCNDTLDDLVMARVEDRGEWMKLFMKHLKGK